MYLIDISNYMVNQVNERKKKIKNEYKKINVLLTFKKQVKFDLF